MMRPSVRFLSSSNMDYAHSLSVHYASTPALNSSNSVESNSVNSDDLDVASSSAASTTTTANHEDHQQHSAFHPSSSNNKQASQTLQRLASVSSSRLYHPATVTVNGTLGRPRSGHAFPDFRVVEPPPAVQPSALSPGSPAPQSGEPDLTVTEDDLRAIETCYRGHKTRVFVCSALANLYRGPRTSLRHSHSESADSWHLVYTGIPVLLHDVGQTKSRLKRQIQLLLVEKGTCFTLWRDVIDNLSQYTAQDPMFHVMHLSTDHLARVGLSFDCAHAARSFHECILALTANPENIALSGAAEKKEKQKHVVSVESKDMDKYFSLQAYVENLRISGGGGGGAEKRAGSHLSHRKGLAPQPPPARSGSLSASQRWGSSPNMTSGGPQLSVFTSSTELRC